MISERSFQTIVAFADEALRTEWGPSRERAELMSARAELDREYWQAQKLSAVMADPDGPIENVRRLRADRQLVDEAVRRHAVEMLQYSTHRPQAREIFPADPFAQAQWHLLRITALQAAPLDVAAAQLREEALAALDTNPKGA